MRGAFVFTFFLSYFLSFSPSSSAFPCFTTVFYFFLPSSGPHFHFSVFPFTSSSCRFLLSILLLFNFLTLLCTLILFILVFFQHIHSRVPGSSTTSTSSPLPPAPVPATAPNPESSPHSWLTAAGDGGQFSSDEADGETPEDTERPAFHYSNHHPQPIGVNTISHTPHLHNFYSGIPTFTPQDLI